MSELDDVAAVLGAVTEVGMPPAAVAHHDAVAAEIASRPVRPPTIPAAAVLEQLDAAKAEALTELTGELVSASCDATGVARPGDVLIFTPPAGMTLTVEHAQVMREHLLARLPGVADVIVVPLVLTGIYRGDKP